MNKAIDSFSIGDFTARYLKPYIIAEIGVNHEGSLDVAKKLIDQAKRGGAHAAKFQVYKAEQLASRNSPAYWDTNKEPTENQYRLFKKYDGFTQRDYQQLAVYCDQRGIDFMATPFDLDAVASLSPLVPAFKIASADITNVPLLRAVGKTKKPLILSTGASTLSEISSAVDVCQQAGAENIALLHCVLNYPTPVEQANLLNIMQLRSAFPKLAAGYSDHVIPDDTLSALEMAVVMGALVLEKHFTHDKTLAGNDHYHAMDETDLTKFTSKLEVYRLLAGSRCRSIDNQTLARLNARRSIVSARPIKQGEILSEHNLTAKRPAHGISPVHWDEVIGKRAAMEIKEDTLLSWDMIEGGLSVE